MFFYVVNAKYRPVFYNFQSLTLKVYIASLLFVCMVVTYSKCMSQLVKAANPGRGQLNRENVFFLVSFRA